ncbi:hypothetical protein KBC75_02350 [Candidatus Shapirobacteria bacterium]|nr:hypothetical protein [Candidatus Shapirobacteria bacterium]
MPTRPVSSAEVKERHEHHGELKRYHIAGLGINQEKIDVRVDLCSMCARYFADLELNVVPVVRDSQLHHLQDVGDRVVRDQ